MKIELRNIFKLEKYTISQLLLLIALIIIVFPLLFTIPVSKIFPDFFQDFFDLSKNSDVGDALGGITAPFINGIAAILVFIAFKEQVKANEIFRRQEESRNILEQIKYNKDDLPDLKDKIEQLKSSIMSLTYEFDQSFPQTKNLINELLYFTSEILLTVDLIEKYSGNKEYLYKKMYYWFVMLWDVHILPLKIEILGVSHQINKDFKLDIDKLDEQISRLTSFFNKPNKFS